MDDGNVDMVMLIWMMMMMNMMMVMKGANHG